MDFILFANILALLFSFFVIGAVLGALFSKPFRTVVIQALQALNEKLLLDRSHYNPILHPGATPWTAEAVLNPAALVLNNRTHLIYRAIGMDGVSRLGYASSPDGLVFDTHLPYPAYVARNPQKTDPRLRIYSPVMYPSGGSWGGCEDPRMVCIDDNVYVTFNMFDNWKLRVAAIVIRKEDFLSQRFTGWQGPIVLSHGDRNKNWVLFPEKIQGQFAVLHSIIGNDPGHVRIEYIDDLALLSRRTFVSPDPLLMPDDRIAWHHRMRSAGPPPIRTSRGWLVLYHAMDPNEPSRYKLGAMLLDLIDPTKVLYRAAYPVLSPESYYENNGKPGVVYACGAVVRDDMLFVYYGGADRVICVATAHLNTFVNELASGEHAELSTQATLSK